MLPTTQEYKIALMIGEDSFRTLQNLEVTPHPSYPNEPWYSTGGLAIVFKIKMKEKFYALKCFYAEANERQERLEHIATYLKQNPSPYFVDFTYLDNELWVETAQGGNGYPVILMEWVEGKTLDNYLAEVCKIQGTARLQNLYFQFCNLAWWLQQQPIAHGDLKHDNIIVTTEGKLKLIDYDGMFVPALQGRKANEQGSPCYQHPQRDTYYFNEHLDDFSLLILQITLLALKQDPSLFKAHYNGDGILLQDTNFSNFAQSSIKAYLWRLDDIKIPLLLSQLQSNLQKLSSIDLMPLLQDVEWINWLIGGQKDSRLVIERQRFKELVLGNRDMAFLFDIQVSQYYSLSKSLLEKYTEHWHWTNLSRSTNLPWTIELIDTYQDWWDWYNLSENEILPWTIEFIDKYKDRWDWGSLSYNPALPWKIEFIDKYKDRWKWNALTYNDLRWTMELIDMYQDRWNWEHLSEHYSLPWTIELIDMHNDRWKWKSLSKNNKLPWTIDLIEKFKDRWDWEYLSSIYSLPWTIDLIEKYQDRWDWYYLSCNNLPWTNKLIDMYKDRWNWKELSYNKLPWTIDLIEKYQNKWNWSKLSINYCLPWTIDLIERYQDKWDWEGLSSNNNLPWTIDLMETYQDKWDWKELSSNNNLPWTIDLMETYQDKWDWKELSSNNNLPWTVDLIEKYQDKWDWKELSSNNNLPWTIDLIEKFKDRWYWDELSNYYSLPWTLDLIEKFKDRWYWRDLRQNEAIYEKILSPLLDDFFIDEVMSSLT